MIFCAFVMRSAFAIAVLLSSQILIGQVPVLRGVASDETGAMIPHATITVTSQSFAKSTEADDRGSWAFAGLQPGDYQVSASAPQLATALAVPVSIGPTTTVTLNLVLKVVGTAQKVTISEETGASLSTDASNNASGLILRGDDLQALSDDPDDLMTDLQALAGPSAGPNGGSIFIDGFSGGELPAKESIREIRINQNPFAPDYDKLGYGKIEIFTKPGSDKYRGSLTYNFMNDALNSRNPYAEAKAPLRLEEFQGNLAGPIGKRISFTIDAQRHMVDNGSIINAVVLDPTSFAPSPFTDILKTPQRRTRITPRIDFQINDKNTLTVRYAYTKVDITDAGVGAFDLMSRAY